MSCDEAIVTTIYSDIGMPLGAYKVLDLMHSGQVDDFTLLCPSD